MPAILCVHLDGVFDRGSDDALRFFQATPTTEDIEGLVVEIAGQGYGGEDEDNVEDRNFERQGGRDSPTGHTYSRRLGKALRREQRADRLPSIAEALCWHRP